MYYTTMMVLFLVICFLFQNTQVESFNAFNNIQHPPRPHRRHHDMKPGFHYETIPLNNNNDEDSDKPYVYPSGLTFGNNITAGWFVNWAQYRKSPYHFFPSNISSIIPKLDILYYGFYFFCPNASMYQPYWADYHDPKAPYCENPDTDGFTVTPIDTQDDPKQVQVTFIDKLKTLRDSLNSDMKIVISFGGWTFPSNFFSQMVSDITSRTTFITSLVSWIEQIGVDGVDFDWEYPGSAPRMDPVEITRSIFKFVNDSGGSPNDFKNYVQFLKELRSTSGMENKLITLCGQAGLMNVDNGFNVSGLTKYADFINVMSYDYFVSGINSSVANVTAPNQPFRAPDTDKIDNWNITGTLVGYIERGAPPQQLLVGIASYGHMWYVPGCDVYNESCWGHMGLAATYPGVNNSRCANITAGTWAGSAGLYTLQCGFYSIYEIQNGGFFNTEIIDPSTMNSMSYTDSPGADDGWTPKGTWITWLGKPGISAVIEFAQGLGIPGAFEFDLSTDAHDDGKWTFEYFHHMATCIKTGSC